MRNSYYFDKREVKKFFGLNFLYVLISLPFVVGLNYLIQNLISMGLMICLDVILILIAVLIGNIIRVTIEKKKENLQKDEELEKLQKQQLLEKSYFKKRNDKKNKK